MVTRSSASPSTLPTSLSPRTTAPTPAGVPVKMRSPGCKIVVVRQERDGVRNVPDHVLQIGLLAQLAVDRERDGAGRVVAVACHGMDRGDRRRLVEGLAEVPRTTHVSRLDLQIAARHVQTDGVAVDMIQRTRGRDLEAATVQSHYQLDLVMQVRRAGRVVHLAALGHDGIGRLEEEKRRLFVRVFAHLARVGGVVASDAVNPMHGEATLVADNRDGRRRAHIDDEGVCHGSCTHWKKKVRRAALYGRRLGNIKEPVRATAPGRAGPGGRKS